MNFWRKDNALDCSIPTTQRLSVRPTANNDHHRGHIRNVNLSRTSEVKMMKTQSDHYHNNNDRINTSTGLNSNSSTASGQHDPTAFDTSMGTGAIDMNTCFYIPSKRKVNTSRWVRAKKDIPKCWLCGIEVKQFGWWGMPSSLAISQHCVGIGRKVSSIDSSRMSSITARNWHRNTVSNPPTILRSSDTNNMVQLQQTNPGGKPKGSVHVTTLTLCQQCSMALSMSCEATAADVLNASKDTFTCKSHSVSFITFLREYKLLLEILGMDLNDVIDERTERKFYDPYTELDEMREEGSSLGRLEDVLYTVREQLDECLLDALTNAISKLTEREILMNERKHIYNVINMILSDYSHCDTSSEVAGEKKIRETEEIHRHASKSFSDTDELRPLIKDPQPPPIATGERDESKKVTPSHEPDHHMTALMMNQFEQLLESTLSLSLDMMFKKSKLVLHESSRHYEVAEMALQRCDRVREQYERAKFVLIDQHRKMLDRESRHTKD